MKLIREKYVSNPFFDPNLVKKVSTACEGLCKWVRAIEVYDRVIKIVSPKKAKLAEAETELTRQVITEKRVLPPEDKFSTTYTFSTPDGQIKREAVAVATSDGQASGSERRVCCYDQKEEGSGGQH